MLNNCRYLRNNVLPKLVDSFRSNDYPISDKLKKVGLCYNIVLDFADGSNSTFSNRLSTCNALQCFLDLFIIYFKVKPVINLEGCSIPDVISLKLFEHLISHVNLL